MAAVRRQAPFLIPAISGTEAYIRAARALLSEGVPARKPRGIHTRDLGFTIIDIASPVDALPNVPVRRLNMKIAATEALQLIAGRADENMIRWASTEMSDYVLDDRGIQHGNYGRRIGDQAYNVVKRLTEDAETRRAVITLWDPILDNAEDKKDYPCTVSLMFDGRQVDTFTWALDMTVVMRSNDIFRGLPYDLFQFSQLQMSLCRALNWIPGGYRHVTNSLHVYEVDLDAIERVADCGINQIPLGKSRARGIGMRDAAIAPTDMWRRILQRATALMFDPYASTMANVTPSEMWYADVVRSYTNPVLTATEVSAADTVIIPPVA